MKCLKESKGILVKQVKNLSSIEHCDDSKSLLNILNSDHERVTSMVKNANTKIFEYKNAIKKSSKDYDKIGMKLNVVNNDIFELNKQLYQKERKLRLLKFDEIITKESKPKRSFIENYYKKKFKPKRIRSSKKINKPKFVLKIFGSNRYSDLKNNTPEQSHFKQPIAITPDIQISKFQNVIEDFLHPDVQTPIVQNLRESVTRQKLKPSAPNSRNYASYVNTVSTNSVRISSVSSRKSSIWSQASSSMKIDEILYEINEISKNIKFKHLKDNIFKFGSKQVTLINKSNGVYARTGGGYIKIKEYIQKNQKVESRKTIT